MTSPVGAQGDGRACEAALNALGEKPFACPEKPVYRTTLVCEHEHMIDVRVCASHLERIADARCIHCGHRALIGDAAHRCPVFIHVTEFAASGTSHE